MNRRTFTSILGSSLLNWPSPGQEVELPERSPNFIVLLCDDLGYGDLGCYGNRSIRTPNIDRAATEGARLTEFYATPTCTPSRASLLTGRYPVRSGMTRVLIPGEHFGIPASEITMGEALKERGYRTACIGKWHLGNRPPYRPNRHGFDYFYGLHYSNDMTLPLVHWPSIKLFRNEEVIETSVKQPTLTRDFTSEASRFISDNKDRPFLLYLPYTMPHLPWSASMDFAGKSKHGAYGDAVEEIDWSVGEILKTVSRNGLDEDTIVIFLSDNGPELITPEPGGSAGPLKGGKGSTWEGGVRVPCVVRWPGRVPRGIVRDGIACTMDLYATVLELAGADVPPDHVIDGRSLIPYLEDKAASPRSEYYYYRGKMLCAVRSENWKLHLFKRPIGKNGGNKELVACNPPELYNLDTDPGEKQNLESKHPAIAASLIKLTKEFETSFVPGRRPPPQWRSVLPRMRRRKKKDN